MKKLISVFALSLVMVLSACSSSESSKSVTTSDVVQAFKDAGLEAESTKSMTKDDYGMAPMKAKEATRFLIPSLGEDMGGRIFVYDNKKDLEEMKAYYDELGKASAMLFSWTIAHGNVLVQISGDLPEEEYNKYKTALENIK